MRRQRTETMMKYLTRRVPIFAILCFGFYESRLYGLNEIIDFYDSEEDIAKNKI